MKKLFLVTCSFIISFSTMAISQTNESVLNKLSNNLHSIATPPEQILITGITMQEGTNTINLKGNKGTITLLKKINLFSNVIFTNNAGFTSRLLPKPCTRPMCAYPLPEACFGTEQIAVINICRTSNTPGSRAFNITVLLPAK